MHASLKLQQEHICVDNFRLFSDMLVPEVALDNQLVFNIEDLKNRNPLTELLLSVLLLHCSLQ